MLSTHLNHTYSTRKLFLNSSYEQAYSYKDVLFHLVLVLPNINQDPSRSYPDHIEPSHTDGMTNCNYDNSMHGLNFGSFSLFHFNLLFGY